MRIMETIVISQDGQYQQELMSELPTLRQRVYGVDVDRLEISEDLIVHLYHFSLEGGIAGEILDHLQGHLSAMVMIADLEQIRNQENNDLDEIRKTVNNVPAILAIRSEKDVLPYNRDAKASGLLLADNARMFFWDPEDKRSKGIVWNAALNTLQFETVNNLL